MPTLQTVQYAWVRRTWKWGFTPAEITGSVDSSGTGATVFPFQGHFKSTTCQMQCSHASSCKATEKFAGNEAVGKPLGTAVPEPLFPGLPGIKGASALCREWQQAFSQKDEVISFN